MCGKNKSEKREKRRDAQENGAGEFAFGINKVGVSPSA